ncbi:hypothetical protein CcaCcLH18_08643 [Colletotrichum camelliae]|nr:hypothetical protein CcaCcLH18_08643 [Colletotrichum camelliae]
MFRAFHYYTLMAGSLAHADNSAFAGITTYGLLPHLPCLKDESVAFDIATIGIPFDSGVTYRPGARFGPSAIRQASRHLTLAGGYNVHDKEIAMKDIEKGYTSLLNRPAYTKSTATQITHGSFFYWANQEGLISNLSNMHAGLRTTLSGLGDYDEDELFGFARIEAREIDDIGTRGIVKKIIERVGTDKPVYLSIDIDTLDPAFAPATGTPETGGWSTRELRAIIRGLSDINIIGADVVEVSPVYDTNAEVTSLAAADLIYEIMSIFVRKGPMTLREN